MPKTAKYKTLKDWKQLEHLLKTVVPEEKKTWVWRAMGRKALALNRERVKQQKNVDGSRYAPREDKNKKPMLKRTLRGKGKRGRTQVGVEAHGEGVVVKSLNPVNIEQHFGSTRSVKAMSYEQLKAHQRYVKRYRNNDRKKRAPGSIEEDGQPCTLDQARVLKSEVGFKTLSFNGGKTRVRATFINLQKAFTSNEAGFIIREHRIRKGQHPKKSWSVTVPPRDVLGISRQDEKILMKYMKSLIFKYSYLNIE